MLAPLDTKATATATAQQALRAVSFVCSGGLSAEPDPLTTTTAFHNNKNNNALQPHRARLPRHVFPTEALPAPWTRSARRHLPPVCATTSLASTSPSRKPRRPTPPTAAAPRASTCCSKPQPPHIPRSSILPLIIPPGIPNRASRMWQDLVDQLPSSRPDAHIIAEAARLQNVPLSAQMLQDYALEQHGLGQQASRRVISRGWVDGRNEADSPKSLSYPPPVTQSPGPQSTRAAAALQRRPRWLVVPRAAAL